MAVALVVGGCSGDGRAAFKYYEDPPFYQEHHIGFRIVTTD